MVLRALQMLLVLLLVVIAAFSGWFGCGLIAMALFRNADGNPFMLWIGLAFVAIASFSALGGGRILSELLPAWSGRAGAVLAMLVLVLSGLAGLLTAVSGL